MTGIMMYTCYPSTGEVGTGWGGVHSQVQVTTFGDCALYTDAWTFHDGGKRPLPAEFPGWRQMGHFGGSSVTGSMRQL